MNDKGKERMTAQGNDEWVIILNLAEPETAALAHSILMSEGIEFDKRSNYTYGGIPTELKVGEENEEDAREALKRWYEPFQEESR
jgi:hypothetical protein